MNYSFLSISYAKVGNKQCFEVRSDSTFTGVPGYTMESTQV